jgi:predicted nucleic acid-binding protein
MVGVVYDRMVLVDTSGIIALLDPDDQFHQEAEDFFKKADDILWFTVNVTSHELFTRFRYDKGFSSALSGYDFLRGVQFNVLSFDDQDEKSARCLLEKYKDHKMSYHDGLCASVMIRKSIYRIFCFDKHFWNFGFEVLPGRTI